MAGFLQIQIMCMALGIFSIVVFLYFQIQRKEKKTNGLEIFFYSYTLHFLCQIMVNFLHYHHADLPFRVLRTVALLYYTVAGLLIFTTPYAFHQSHSISHKRDILFIVLFVFYELLIILRFPYQWGPDRNFFLTDFYYNLAVLLKPIVFGYVAAGLIFTKFKRMENPQRNVLRAVTLICLLNILALCLPGLSKIQMLTFNEVNIAIVLDTLLYFSMTGLFFFKLMRGSFGIVNKSHEEDIKVQEKIPDFNLSQREEEVLHYVIKGLAYKEIADILCISESTIKTHVTRIFNKAGCSKRSELIYKVLSK